MVVLDDVKNLVIYKKPFFLPIDENDKKRNSVIMLLTPNYQSSINAMKAPYIINRRYFESYYLEKNVYRYINSEGYIENPSDEKYLMNVNEANLSTSERNNLPDDAFGLPSQRRYPMPDKEHVLLAIRFFNHVEEKYEKELAHNITRKIIDFNMEDEVHVTEKNRYYKYWVKDFPEQSKKKSVVNEAKIKNPDLYFISPSSEFNDGVLHPRIPDNFLTKNGYEDAKTPRVCFSTNIDGCLKGLSQNLTGKEFYIYKPVGFYDVITPTEKQVPDVKITNERWITSPVDVKMIGKIKVTGDDGKPGYKYKYGNNEAELYGWNWKWIDQYNESAYYCAPSNKSNGSSMDEDCTWESLEDAIKQSFETKFTKDDGHTRYVYAMDTENILHCIGSIDVKSVDPLEYDWVEHIDLPEDFVMYETEEDLEFSYYFSDEIKKKFNDTVNMANIEDEAINEAAATIKKVSVIISNGKNKIICGSNKKDNTLCIPSISINGDESNIEAVMRLCSSSFNITVTKTKLLYNFVYSNNGSDIIDDAAFMVEEYDGTLSKQDTDDLKHIRFMSAEEIVYRGNLSKELQRFISQYGSKMIQDPTEYIAKKAGSSNISYAGYESDVSAAQAYINSTTLKAMFSKCGVKYPKSNITVIISGIKNDYGYIDENNITILSKSIFEKEFHNYRYTDYIKFVSAIFVYHTVNPDVLDSIVQPLAMYKSGNVDNALNNKNDHRYDMERVFKYIYDTYGDKALINVVQLNRMSEVYRYAKELIGETTDDLFKEMAEIIEEQEDQICRPEDIADIGKKITRKIKQASVYKLNKIKRDIERGNTGAETRTTTDLQKIQTGNIVNASTPDKTTNELAYIVQSWANNDILIGENVMYFFEDAINYDMTLRQSLYSDRIRNTKQVLEIYKKVKSDCPFIRFAFTELNRYDNKNLYFDLSYYNESYFRNSSTVTDANSKKSMKIYKELLQRLIDDNRFTSYTKKTIFIPVLDWRHNNSMRMWMYKEDLNPISIIFDMMKYDVSGIQKLFRNTDLVFMGSGNYFKLNFSQVDMSKDNVVQRFIQAIKRIVALGFNHVDPDPDDEPEHSAKAIALDIVDKVEKSQNIEIKSIKPIMKATEKDPFKDDKPEVDVAIKKVEGDNTSSSPDVVIDKQKVSRPSTNGKQEKITTVKAVKTSITTSKEDIEKSTKIDKTANAVNTPTVDKQKENLVAMIAKASADSSSTDEALEKLDDEEFKRLLAELNSQEEENVRTSNARAARITELSNAFQEKEVAGKSVKDLLAQNPNDIKLPETKLNVASIDDTWSKMTFMNFDKNYDPDSDIVKMLDNMKNWSYPIAVRDIHVTDNSTSEDYVNLWDIDCEDFKGTRFKLKVDIPKFINDKFLKLRGNEKSLMLQSTLMPIIKTDLDTCQIIGVGGYNKIFVRRYGSGSGKSMPNVDKLIKTLNRYSGDDLKIVRGDNTKICNKYELPIDYIDLASYYDTIENNEFILYFNQDEFRKLYQIDDSKGLPLGIYKNVTTEDGKVQDTIIYYDIKCAKDFKTVSRYITYIIMGNINNPKEIMDIYNSIIATGKRYMYSKASILSVKIPLVVVCAYVEGLTTTLKKAGIDYSFKQKLEKTDRISDDIDYIPFSDGYLIYNVSYVSSMLMNGLKECDTESYSVKDVNSKEMYIDFLTEFGGSLKSDGLENSYDCMIDPITREILEIYKLPTDYVSVLLYANALLADNKFIKHTDMSVRRLRRKELIAGYFYKALTIAYQSYANQIRHTRKSVKMTMKQSAVIDMILSRDPSTNDLSVNNAINDVECANTVTSKGLVGMNSDRAYSLDKRGFDDSMLNVLGMSTGFSGNVGINRIATIDCNIQGARGFVVPIDNNIEKFNTAKTLTITEALTPFGSTHDDTFRTLMTFIQTSKHMVRTDVSDPLLVTNGSDEAMPYLTSDIFAFKAKKNGKIIELVQNENNRDSYMVIEYDDGTHDFIDLSEVIKKNSDGGYFVPMKLSTDLSVGKRVKEGDVVAYDKQSFSSSLGESGHLALNVGTLAKVAIMNTDEGFEDSAACTAKFARKMGTDVVVKKDVSLSKDVNVQLMKKIGEQVTEGDVLLSYQASFDDDVANSLLRNLSMDSEEISELGRNPIKSKYSGVLADIKIYRTVEMDELSPSLQELVKMYEEPIKKIKDVYDQYGLDSATLPPTTKVGNVGKTKKVYDGVLIEFYIKYNDTMAIGDKVVFYSANKGIIKYIIPDGDEPYTDFRPNEKVDAFVSIGSINGRMVCSTVVYGAIAKLMVELDRSCKDLAGIPYDASKI